MGKNRQKRENLVFGLGAALPLEISIGEGYKAFMNGELVVYNPYTGEQLNPSDYHDCKLIGISQEKMAEHFNTCPRKSQDQESNTCKMHQLLRRASQLRNELSAINKQLNETYGIALLDGFLSLHDKSHASRTPRQDGIGRYQSCSQKGRKPNVQEVVSRLPQEEPGFSCRRDVLDRL